jgi:hypothetical protein
MPIPDFFFAAEYQDLIDLVARLVAVALIEYVIIFFELM